MAYPGQSGPLTRRVGMTDRAGGLCRTRVRGNISPLVVWKQSRMSWLLLFGCKVRPMCPGLFNFSTAHQRRYVRSCIAKRASARHCARHAVPACEPRCISAAGAAVGHAQPCAAPREWALQRQLKKHKPARPILRISFLICDARLCRRHQSAVRKRDCGCCSG